MAGSSLLALLDDIASILDDVSLMTKVAAKKTAGVLGDDLALNAQQVAGVRAERELPVVWAVAVGSMKNKAILVPAALAISAFAPWAITPLLMVGGAYLCFEGFEKIAHKYLHPDDSHKAELAQALRDPQVDLVALEKDKIKGAIRTDFILSAEIIVIALGTVATATFAQQVAVVVGIAIIMTVGVYGLVAGIVKLDDAGFYLSARKGAGALMDGVRAFGRMLVSAAPKLMKFLSVVGTLAMFMVGGGILTHGWPWASAMLHQVEVAVGSVALVGPVLAAVTPSLINAVAGVIAGGLVLAGVTAVSALLRRLKPAK
jgi:predicted DNA repair protein MutK